MSISVSDVRLIAGTWFDGHSARGQPAQLRITPNGPHYLDIDGSLRPVDLAAVKVSARIGNIPRRIDFAGGGHFETPDNDGVDLLLRQQHRSPGVVQWLERHRKAALASLAAVVVICVLFVTLGLPWVAMRIADLMPRSADAKLGSGVLQVLDGRLFNPSTLSAQRHRELQGLFDDVVRGYPGAGDWQLELRDVPRVGANAFALPGGTVVLTDQMVALARDDRELLAVLAHEVGHVNHRHGLRQLVQAMGVSALALAVFGDVTVLSSLTGLAPQLLQAGYSRNMEREADAFARAWLARAGIAQSHFDDLMCRLDAAHRGQGKPAKDARRYFDSHPAVSERAHCTP